MKIVYRIIGSVIGAALGLSAYIALIAFLSDGNMVAEGFLFVLGAPIGLLAGAIAGAIFASRAAKRLGDPSKSDTVRRRKRRVTLALVLGIPAAFAFMGWVTKEAHEPPSDAAMLREFGRHEATYNTLIEMATTDKALDRVDQNWTIPADPQSIGVSPERLAKYRSLLRAAGTPRGFQRLPGRDGFNFFFFLQGSAISDDKTKGFSYQTAPPERIVQTLDDIRADSRDGFTSYRHIGGNWYLFYEFTPD